MAMGKTHLIYFVYDRYGKQKYSGNETGANDIRQDSDTIVIHEVKAQRKVRQPLVTAEITESQKSPDILLLESRIKFLEKQLANEIAKSGLSNEINSRLRNLLNNKSEEEEARKVSEQESQHVIKEARKKRNAEIRDLVKGTNV